MKIRIFLGFFLVIFSGCATAEEADEIRRESYDEGYNLGLETGYERGYADYRDSSDFEDACNEDFYDDWHAEGYDEGYQVGYDEGESNAEVFCY